MAAKILARLIVIGTSILGRAFIQAYRQALAKFLHPHPQLSIFQFHHIQYAEPPAHLLWPNHHHLQLEDPISHNKIKIKERSFKCITGYQSIAYYFHHASKTGVAQETLQNAVRKGSKVMTEQEARQILGISEETTWEEVLKKYDTLFENNAKNGSFYLQSKVHRAKECLEASRNDKGQSTPS